MVERLRAYLGEIKGRPYQGAHALPGAFYTDSDWFIEERNRLFGNSWVCVGRLEEVERSGDYFCCVIAGEPVIVIRGDDDRLRALSNVCRHRGTVIAEGKGNCKSLVCPYHHWQYGRNGRLLNAPRFDNVQKSMSLASPLDPGKHSLPEFRCISWQGFIFVSLLPDTEDLSGDLRSLEDRITPYHLEQMRLQYLESETWQVNWKCLMENFMEGYHLSPLHRKTLHKVNPSRLCQHIPPGSRHFAYSVGFTSRVPAEKVGHPALSNEDKDTCIMFAVPPALAVGVGSDYSSFICMQPEAPTRVRVKMGLIFYGEEWRDNDVETAIRLFRETMAEDKAVLLRVQQGMGSNYFHPGPLAPPELEGTIWDFHQYLARNLDQAPS